MWVQVTFNSGHGKTSDASVYFGTALATALAPGPMWLTLHVIIM
jgi:hypothetical protein